MERNDSCLVFCYQWRYLTKCLMIEPLLWEHKHTHTHIRTHTHKMRRIPENGFTLKVTVSRMSSSHNCCLMQNLDEALSQVLLCWNLKVVLLWCNISLAAMLDNSGSADSPAEIPVLNPKFTTYHFRKHLDPNPKMDSSIADNTSFISQVTNNTKSSLEEIGMTICSTSTRSCLLT